MNRRLRSPLADVHRFLRPGALARLRDSRLATARAPRRAAAPRLASPPSPPPPPAADGMPCFVARAWGPSMPRRRKLAASKFVFFAPASPEVGVDLFGDGFGGGDLVVVAH